MHWSCDYQALLHNFVSIYLLKISIYLFNLKKI